MARCLSSDHPQALLPAVMRRVCRVCWCAAAASAAAERGDGGDGAGGGANKAPGMRESKLQSQRKTISMVRFLL